MFAEHENGQLRLAVAGEQISLLPLPDDGIPNETPPQTVDATPPALPSTGATRERLERRATRRRDWAASRTAAADVAHDRARALADMIPFGQPILVGHHSEGRARRDQARIANGMRASVDHSRMADRHERAAGELEAQLARSIYSDDVDAVDLLAGRIMLLEAERDRVKAYNALRRKRKTHDGIAEDAAAAGLDERQKRDLLTVVRVQPYACKHGAFPAYHLQNLGGNITRNRKRLEQLQRDESTREAGGRGIGRAMLARFSSTCPDCGAPIVKGAAIVYYKVTREAVHADCA